MFQNLNAMTKFDNKYFCEGLNVGTGYWRCQSSTFQELHQSPLQRQHIRKVPSSKRCLHARNQHSRRQAWSAAPRPIPKEPFRPCILRGWSPWRHKKTLIETVERQGRRNSGPRVPYEQRKLLRINGSKQVLPLPKRVWSGQSKSGCGNFRGVRPCYNFWSISLTMHKFSCKWLFITKAIAFVSNFQNSVFLTRANNKHWKDISLFRQCNNKNLPNDNKNPQAKVKSEVNKGKNKGIY